MKKVAFIIGYYPLVRGGAELQSRYFCDELKNIYEVFYISIHGMHKRNDEFINDGLKVYALKSKSIMNRNYCFLNYSAVVKILKREKPDIIYVKSPDSSGGVAASYCSGEDCKLVFHSSAPVHVQPLKLSMKKTIMLDIIERGLTSYGFKNVDFVICQAEYQKKLLIKSYGKKKSGVIYNIHKPVKNTIIKENIFKVLWISNIKMIKRPDLFFNIVAKFANNEKIEFLIAGRNTSKDFILKTDNLVAKYNNFNYLGELPNDEVNKLLEKSHILVNTSISEGMPNIFIQAWLREVVVVSLDVDPDDFIVNQKIGFRSGSIEQLIKDIEYLFNNPGTRNIMGKKARKFAEEKFNWDTNVTKFKEVLKSLE